MKKVPLIANTTIGVNNKIIIPPKGIDPVYFPEFDEEKIQWKPQPVEIRPTVRSYTHRWIDLKKMKFALILWPMVIKTRFGMCY